MHDSSDCFNGSIVSKGTSEINGKWSWLSLIVMLYFFPAVLMIMYPFYPESPYWLLKKGRTEDARRSLIKIHGSGDPGFIEIELRRIDGNFRASEELARESRLQGPGIVRAFQGTNLVIEIFDDG